MQLQVNGVRYVMSEGENVLGNSALPSILRPSYKGHPARRSRGRRVPTHAAHTRAQRGSQWNV